MRSLQATLFLLTLLACLSCVYASPIQKRSFKIRRHPRPLHHQRNGHQAMLNAYNKWGFDLGSLGLGNPSSSDGSDSSAGSSSTTTPQTSDSSQSSGSSNPFGWLDPLFGGSSSGSSGQSSGSSSGSSSSSGSGQSSGSSSSSGSGQSQGSGQSSGSSGSGSGSGSSGPSASSAQPFGANPSSQPTTTSATSQPVETSSVPQSSQSPSTGSSGSGSSGSGETAEVDAVPESGDSAYLEAVSIGGQTLNLDFDTGSADLWVFNTQLPSSELGSHTAFDPSKSSTFKSVSGDTWQIKYGDGSSASGNAGTDTVKIGGATVTQQVVELATSVSGSFVRDQNSDGLVGLAFSSINTVRPNQAKTFFDNVKSSLAKPVFSVDLHMSGDGSYEFGAIDTSNVEGGTLTTIPIDQSTGFWEFSSNTFSINGKTQTNSVGNPAIADTGTSLMIVDDNVAEAYYAAVEGSQNDSSAGGYTFPCNAALPDFYVAMGDSHMAKIPGSAITYGRTSSDTCFGGIQGNSGSNLQIYGDIFFRAQYVVFDGGNMALQVGDKATIK